MPKFDKTGQSVEEIIERVKSKSTREDAYRLLNMFEEIMNEVTEVWHPNFIGFSEYYYEYETGHSRKSPILAFSPK